MQRHVMSCHVMSCRAVAGVGGRPDQGDVAAIQGANRGALVILRSTDERGEPRRRIVHPLLSPRRRTKCREGDAASRRAAKTSSSGSVNANGVCPFVTGSYSPFSRPRLGLARGVPSFGRPRRRRRLGGACMIDSYASSLSSGASLLICGTLRPLSTAPQVDRDHDGRLSHSELKLGRNLMTSACHMNVSVFSSR